MTNETQSLMLGDVNIGEYLIPVQKNDSPSLVIDSKLEKFKKLEKNIFQCEKKDYNKLYSKILSIKYPLLDLSFLEKSSIIYYEIEKTKTEKFIHSVYKKNWFGKERLYTYDIIKETPFKEKTEIKVPAFSVYPLYGTNKLSITVGALGSFEINNRKKILPLEIELKLLKALKVLGVHGSSAEPQEDQFGGRIYLSDLKNIPYETQDKYLKFEFESEFNGILPKKTRQKIKEAEKYFDKNELYIIPETKPKEWKFNLIEMPEIYVNFSGYGDPLIVGVKEKNYHLIDHFNTTPLENLVKDNFLGDKLN